MRGLRGLLSALLALSIALPPAGPAYALRGGQVFERTGDPQAGGLEELADELLRASGFGDQAGAEEKFQAEVPALGLTVAARRGVGDRKTAKGEPSQQDDFSFMGLGRKGEPPVAVVAVVADGNNLLGHVASGMAVKRTPELLAQPEFIALLEDYRAEGTPTLEGKIQLTLRHTLEQVSSEILKGTRSLGATTVVAALVVGRTAFIAHAGDSRAYRWGREGLDLLTADHNAAWVRQIGEGRSPLEISRRVREHILRNPQDTAHTELTSSLGGMQSKPRIDVVMVNLQKGDRLLLVTDGVTRWVGEPLLESQMLGRKELSGPEVVETIMAQAEAAARSAGRRADNQTALLIDVVKRLAELPPVAAGAEERRVRLGVERLEDRTTPSSGWGWIGDEPIALSRPLHEPPNSLLYAVRMPEVMAEMSGSVPLARLPQAGALVLELERPVTGWSKGDRLRFTGVAEGGDQELRIAGILNEGRTITLERPLQAAPQALPGMKVAVVKLSRAAAGLTDVRDSLGEIFTGLTSKAFPESKPVLPVQSGQNLLENGPGVAPTAGLSVPFETVEIFPEIPLEEPSPAPVVATAPVAAAEPAAAAEVVVVAEPPVRLPPAGFRTDEEVDRAWAWARGLAENMQSNSLAQVRQEFNGSHKQEFDALERLVADDGRIRPGDRKAMVVLGVMGTLTALIVRAFYLGEGREPAVPELKPEPDQKPKGMGPSSDVSPVPGKTRGSPAGRPSWLSSPKAGLIASVLLGISGLLFFSGSAPVAPGGISSPAVEPAVVKTVQSKAAVAEEPPPVKTPLQLPVWDGVVSSIRADQSKAVDAAVKTVGPEVDYLYKIADTETRLLRVGAASAQSAREANLNRSVQVPKLLMEQKIAELGKKVLSVKDPAEQAKVAGQMIKAFDEYLAVRVEGAKEVVGVRTQDLETEQWLKWRGASTAYGVMRADMKLRKAEIELKRLEEVKALMPDLVLLGPSLPVPEGLVFEDSKLLHVLRTIPAPSFGSGGPPPDMAVKQAAFTRFIRGTSRLMALKSDSMDQSIRLLSEELKMVNKLANTTSIAMAQVRAANNLIPKRIAALRKEQDRLAAQRFSLDLLDPDLQMRMAVASSLDPFKVSIAIPLPQLAWATLDQANGGHLQALITQQQGVSGQMETHKEVLTRVIPRSYSAQERVIAGLNAKTAKVEQKQLEEFQKQEGHIKALGLPSVLVTTPRSADLQKAFNIMFGSSSPTVDIGSSTLPMEMVTPAFRDPKGFLSLATPGLKTPLSKKEAAAHAAAAKAFQVSQLRWAVKQFETEIAYLRDIYSRKVALGKDEAWNDPDTYALGLGIPNTIEEIRAIIGVLEVKAEILEKGSNIVRQQKLNMAVSAWWDERLASAVAHRNFLEIYIGQARNFSARLELDRHRLSLAKRKSDVERLEADIARNQKLETLSDPAAGLIVPLPTPETVPAALPDAGKIAQDLKKSGLPLARITMVRNLETGKLEPVLWQEGFGRLTAPRFAGDNPFWENGISFKKIPSGFPKLYGDFAVTPRPGLVFADAGGGITGLTPAMEGSLSFWIVELMGPVRDPQMETGIYYLSGTPASHGNPGLGPVGEWPSLLAFLPRVDNEGRVIRGAPKEGVTIYPRFFWVADKDGLKKRVVGGVIQRFAPGDFSKVLAQISKGETPSRDPVGKDADGREIGGDFLPFGTNLWIIGKNGLPTQVRLRAGPERQPLVFEDATDAALAPLLAVPDKNPDLPKKKLDVPKRIKKVEKVAPGVLKFGQGQAVLHNLAGNWGADGRLLDLPAPLERAMRRLDGSLAKVGYDGWVVLSDRSPAAADPSGASYLYVEESFLEGIDRLRFTESVVGRGMQLRVIGGYAAEGNRVLQEVLDLRRNEERVIMMVGRDYAEPIRSWFGEGAEHHEYIPTVAVVDPVTSVASKLLQILASVFFKQGIHEFTPVASGLEQEREGAVFLFRGA